MASGSVIVRVAYVLVGADDQTPVDVGNALTHSQCLSLKIDIGPLQCEAFVDSQPTEGEQSNQHTIGLVVHCVGKFFQPRQGSGQDAPFGSAWAK
jgi:hypothetical protein